MEIQLESDAEFVVLDIKDQGKGIPDELLEELRKKSKTVGLAGMRERVSELGGDLTVSSGPKGTTVHVVIPNSGRTLQRRAQPAA